MPAFFPFQMEKEGRSQGEKASRPDFPRIAPNAEEKGKGELPVKKGKATQGGRATGRAKEEGSTINLTMRSGGREAVNSKRANHNRKRRLF